MISGCPCRRKQREAWSSSHNRCARCVGIEPPSWQACGRAMGLQMGGVDHQPIRLTTLAVSSAEMGLKTPSRSSGSAGRRSYCAGHWDRLLAPTRPFQITKMMPVAISADDRPAEARATTENTALPGASGPRLTITAPTSVAPSRCCGWSRKNAKHDQ